MVALANLSTTITEMYLARVVYRPVFNSIPMFVLRFSFFSSFFRQASGTGFFEKFPLNRRCAANGPLKSKEPRSYFFRGVVKRVAGSVADLFFPGLKRTADSLSNRSQANWCNNLWTEQLNLTRSFF